MSLDNQVTGDDVHLLVTLSTPLYCFASNIVNCGVHAGLDQFTPSEVGYRELYQLYELVRTQLGYEPIVIDADDLLKYPGGLKLYTVVKLLK